MSAPDDGAVVIERLRHLDPAFYERMVATAAAVIAGGEVPCPVCDVVAIDANAWRVHAEADHLGGAA